MLLNKKKGFSLVEVLITSSVLIIFISALIASINVYLKQSDKNRDDVKIGFLLEEGIEALKTIRDESWTNKIATLDTDTKYYLEYTTDKWIATSSNLFIDNKYERSFILEEAYRDGNSDLNTSGTIDNDAKLLTVEVYWFDNNKQSTSSKSLSTYIINLFDN
jgi:Tfp pilus assembly protein PilV